jgi:hypothetical protein
MREYKCTNQETVFKQVLKISFQNFNLKIKTNNVLNTFTIYPTKIPLNLPLTISHV